MVSRAEGREGHEGWEEKGGVEREGEWSWEVGETPSLQEIFILFLSALSLAFSHFHSHAFSLMCSLFTYLLTPESPLL